MKKSVVQIVYDKWSENHIDPDAVKELWKKVTSGVPVENTERLNTYAEALQQQAFHAGFSAGVTLMSECFTGGNL